VQPLLLWKNKNITYSGCVSVALRIQHVMSMGHIDMRGLLGSKIFFHIFS